jgi:hypothetical protein
MALFKWLFDKKIDPEHLKKELGSLDKIFRGYIVFFKEKSEITNYQFKERNPIDSGLDYVMENFNFSPIIFKKLKREASKFNRDLLKELNQEKKEEKIVQIILKYNLLNLTEKEAVISIKSKLEKLKQILAKQLELFEELDKLPFFNNAAKIVQDKLLKLLQEEEELLFEEKESLQNITKNVVNNQEFPVINRVSSYPAIKESILADRYLSAFGLKSRIDITKVSEIPVDIASKEYALVFYPGSGHDLITLFCFPKADIYVYQDLSNHKFIYPQVTIGLEILNRTNIIHNLIKKRNRFEFMFNGKKKLLIVYSGRKGDATKYLAPEIKHKGVDMMYSKAFGVGDFVINGIFDKVGYYLRKNCLINDVFLTGDGINKGVLLGKVIAEMKGNKIKKVGYKKKGGSFVELQTKIIILRDGTTELKFFLGKEEVFLDNGYVYGKRDLVKEFNLIKLNSNWWQKQ